MDTRCPKLRFRQRRDQGRNEEPSSTRIGCGSSRAVRRRDDEGAALTSIDEMGHNEEVGATQVDRESSIFDMTVADSPDEDDVPRDVSRRRRRARRRVQDSHGATNEEGSASPRAVWRLVFTNNQPQCQHQHRSTRPTIQVLRTTLRLLTALLLVVTRGALKRRQWDFQSCFGRQVRGQQEAFASVDGVDLKGRLKFKACKDKRKDTVDPYPEGVEKLRKKTAKKESFNSRRCW